MGFLTYKKKGPAPVETSPAPARTAQASAHWADPATLEQVGYRPGDTWFGYTLTAHRAPFGYSDDRHVVTIAGSRAGKGTSTIIPNLCEHPGSLICIDPKGENATITAARRGPGSPYAIGMGQAVWVLDPFKVARVDDNVRGHFNPLDCIDPDSDEAVDDAAAIAEALIVAADAKDAHWDESARNFLQGLILYVVVTEAKERQHLPRVRELLMLGDREAAASLKESGDSADPFLLLLARMEQREEFHGVIAGAATTLTGTGEKERGSILSTARRNTAFIDSPGMREILSRSSFSLDDLKTAPRGLSLYLCLPARRLETHGRWLRTVVMLALGHMERLGRRPATGHPILFVLDEFATLGYLSSLEKAAGFIASYGVKLWVILQDLNQLKAVYKERWETFLGNAGILQFFGNSDMTTLEYISKRLGETEFRQQTTGTSTSQSQSRSFSRSDSRSYSSGTSLSESFSPRTWFSGGRTTGTSASSNFSSGESTGVTHGTSDSTSSSVSQNESIAVAPLLRPDEVAKFFGRGTGRQLLFVAGAPPIVLGQTIYFRDPYFLGKYDPHPDFPDSAPPTLESMRARQLALAQRRKKLQLIKFAVAAVAAGTLGYFGLYAYVSSTHQTAAILPQPASVPRQATPIPTAQLSIMVERLDLESTPDGHLLKIRSRLTNQSQAMLGEARIAWKGQVCMRPGALLDSPWRDCTAIELVQTIFKASVPPNSSSVWVETIGPVQNLKGRVTVEGALIAATE